MTETNKPGVVTEAQWAKALAHPIRERILRLLDGRECSPGDLAAEMSLPLGVVSYHVRMLRDYGMVELTRTEPRRGALQHYYRTVRRTAEVDTALLKTQLSALFGVPEAAIHLNVTISGDGTAYSVEVAACGR